MMRTKAVVIIVAASAACCPHANDPSATNTGSQATDGVRGRPFDYVTEFLDRHRAEKLRAGGRG
jgi:hypothetical protein